MQECLWEQVSTLELSAEEFECPEIKNVFLRREQGPAFLFVEQETVWKEELEEVLRQEEALKQAELIAFYGGETAEQGGLGMVIEHFDMRLIALAFSRSLVKTAGGYNENLRGLTNYELLCRLTETAGSCILVPVSGAEGRRLTEEDVYTYAYILRRYLRELCAWSKMEGLLNRLSRYAAVEGLSGCLKQCMDRMLGEGSVYREIAWDTAPFAIVRGDDTCSGVLRDFADRLYQELTDLGQAVIMIDTEFQDYERLRDGGCKGVIGFQAAALEMDFFRQIPCRKFQFWFDYPLHFGKCLRNLPEEYYILCQDADHAELIREYYHTPNAIQFPPGGMDAGYWKQQERPYDIVFIGSYYREDIAVLEGREKAFYEYMVGHPHMTFEEGLRRVLEAEDPAGSYGAAGNVNPKKRGKSAGDAGLSKEEFAACMQSMDTARHMVRGYYRNRVIDTILEAGFELHVYGEEWRDYRPPVPDRLVIHPRIAPGDALAEWGRAKIGLNVMAWHKAGMTERIANIMLSGSVCLSDETVYLREHFEDGREIVCFDLEHLEDLPDKINNLLENEKLRRSIAENAYRKAAKEYTWASRARQLLALAEQGETKRKG